MVSSIAAQTSSMLLAVHWAGVPRWQASVSYTYSTFYCYVEKSKLIATKCCTKWITYISVIFGFIGACYDALNNLIWTCSSDYIDQWCNPGNQAFHHLCHRLGVSHIIKEPKGKFESNPQKH